MRNKIINLLFRLLGQSYTRQYNIPYLFGASTATHEARKKKWENALARMYKDKDLLDFLYYQAESDKENIFRGKVNADFSKGARLRTFFIVYSARRAYLMRRQGDSNKKAERDEEMGSLSKAYKQMTDVEN